MHAHLPVELTSPRLLLRHYQEADAGLYFRMVQENRDHLHEFLPEVVERMQSEVDVLKFILWLEGERQQRNLFLFGAWEQESGCYVGEAYLANPDWHVPGIELGYFLVQGSTGRGYATEAARRVLQYAFEQLEVSRVDLQCRADNPGSIRVAERLGFRMEGCQRLRHRKKDGNLVDRLWYGLLRQEWIDQPGG